MINKRSNNLCDVYMLPLVDLNSSSFGIGNFINSYINENDQFIVAKIKQINSIIKANVNYRYDIQETDFTYVIYEIPKQFLETVRLFREGKYSMFSEDSKNVIRKKSGLAYKVSVGQGKTMTARPLLVLDKDINLKKEMEEQLDVKLGNQELASIPGEDNFILLNVSKELSC